MAGHVKNAQALAEYLQTHPNVERVLYPGLPDHPGHAVAQQQMNGFGAMLSVCFKGGEEEARRVINSLKIFTRATSLGGVESLIEHRATVEGPDTKTPFNLLRISVGLEHIDDLIADMEQAIG